MHAIVQMDEEDEFDEENSIDSEEQLEDDETDEQVEEVSAKHRGQSRNERTQNGEQTQ